MTRILGLGRRSERGQMTALMAVSIVAICAMGAFVMDVGSWFRAHRATQSVSDAAALAGAQKLPLDQPGAQALAQEYGDKNGGGITQIQFSSNTFANDTISVRAERVAPGFLSQVLGISSVNVGADATARSWNLGSARYAAPFAVDKAHPMLSGSGCPCFNQPTTLDLETVGPGAFRIVNIDGYMGLGWSYSDPGAKFNPGPLEDALRARSGDELLFPVYDTVREQGAGFEYNIVGWVGFRLSGFNGQGNNSELHGSFTSVTWEGMPSDSGDNFFGATVVKLVS